MEAHQSSDVPDLKLICPLSRHGCRMPRNNRHRKKLRFFCDDSCFHAFWGQNGHRPAKTDRFFCDDNAGTGTSSMLKHDSPRACNVGAQHITYQHIMLSPLLPKLEGRRLNKLIIKKLSVYRKNTRIISKNAFRHTSKNDLQTVINKKTCGFSGNCPCHKQHHHKLPSLQTCLAANSR